MNLIICSIIILWLTVVVIIQQIYKLDRMINRYNDRIYANFAQSHQNKQHIDSINRYVDDKAMEASTIDKMGSDKYVDGNGDIYDKKENCIVEAPFIKDITEEYNMMFNQLAGRCKALEQEIKSIREDIKGVRINERKTYWFAYDSKEELTNKITALEDKDLDITKGYFTAFEKDVSAGHLSNKKAIRAVAEHVGVDVKKLFNFGLKEDK